MADQPWIQIAGGSGEGTGQFTVLVSTEGLPAAGAATGTVTIVQSGARNSPTVSVRVAVMAASESTAPFGVVDTPRQGAVGVSGAMTVTGWTLDDVEVTRVQIFRDPVSPESSGAPVYLGDAVFVPDSRPDVERAYPLLPLNRRAGWGFLLLSNLLPRQGNGVFTFRVLATDADGHQTWLDARTFAGDNANATKPFGVIDTPGQTAVASGDAYVNTGWALTPRPKSIPFDGSTIEVLVDGVVVGKPGPLGARPDIQALFPGYANTDRAVGSFALDTTVYESGLHTLAWIVTDSAGVSEAIGSGYFKVDRYATGSAPDTAPDPPLTSDGTTVPTDAALLVRTGYDATAPFDVVPAGGGTRQVVGRELERLEIQWASDGTARSWLYDGYLLVGNERRALPIGSTLDASKGDFFWQPGVGFVGRYSLVFVRTAVDGRVEDMAVEIVLQPRHPSATDVLLRIDEPSPGALAGSFRVAGWAIDRGALISTGIDAVHVWAYPNPGSGSQPVFLGAAQLGGLRSDVRKYYSEQFGDSAYELVVDGLAPGVYDLAVFPHSTVTGQFSVPEAVRVVVR
jgi:hypothetical protein